MGPCVWILSKDDDSLKCQAIFEKETNREFDLSDPVIGILTTDDNSGKKNYHNNEMFSVKSTFTPNISGINFTKTRPVCGVVNRLKLKLWWRQMDYYLVPLNRESKLIVFRLDIFLSIAFLTMDIPNLNIFSLFLRFFYYYSPHHMMHRRLEKPILIILQYIYIVYIHYIELLFDNHYENMPIQIYWKFYHKKKMKIFSKKFWYFSYFCSKHRLWVLVRTALARRF